MYAVKWIEFALREAHTNQLSPEEMELPLKEREDLYENAGVLFKNVYFREIVNDLYEAFSSQCLNLKCVKVGSFLSARRQASESTESDEPDDYIHMKVV